MADISKKFIFFICAVIFYPSLVLSETDFSLFFKDASQYQDVVVKEVLSVNTITLEGERGEIITLIGLRAPDLPRSKKESINRDQYGFTIKKEVDPMTPIEEKAFDFVKEFLEGQHVRLEFDAEKKDDSYATLAYVFLLKDDTFVNAEILRQGFAHLSISPPNTKYAHELREAYKEARSEKRGLQGQ
jgi:endonuclease YncB( thermonuclease family)